MTRGLLLATSAACVGCLVYSVWTGFPETREVLGRTRAVYGAMSEAERQRAFVSAVPLRTDIFDFYKTYLRPGDRYYIQIVNGPFGAYADKETAVRSVARLYLLPAVEARSLRDATVVLSWDTDPAALPLRYSRKIRAGAQLIFVSRILGLRLT
jgi:hypothetical protein